MDWYTKMTVTADAQWDWGRFGNGLLQTLGAGSAILVLMVYFNMDRSRAEEMVNNYPQVAEQQLSVVPPQAIQQIVQQGQSAQVANQQAQPQKAQPVQVATAITAGELMPQIKRHEGTEHIAYKDTKGNMTVGVGFNLERADARTLISQVGADFDKVYSRQQALNDQQINQLLNVNINEAMEIANSFIPNLSSHPKKVQLVVADMCFNMGPAKMSQFVKFQKRITERNYAAAALEMQNSAWYTQVGQRSKNLVQMMNSASIEGMSSRP